MKYIRASIISTAVKASLLFTSLMAISAYTATAVERGHLVRRQRLAAVGLVGTLALSLSPIPALAVIATNTFGVSANVPASCLITATALAFGNYTGAQTDSASTLSVTCTNTTTYSVGLGAGTSGGTATARQMAGPNTGLFLFYGLFSDAARTINWGDTGGTGIAIGTGTGATQTITVFGRVSAGQLVAPGAYADTITATVTY
jgi:spore coat protein U-like protein